MISLNAILDLLISLLVILLSLKFKLRLDALQVSLGHLELHNKERATETQSWHKESIAQLEAIAEVIKASSPSQLLDAVKNIQQQMEAINTLLNIESINELREMAQERYNRNREMIKETRIILEEHDRRLATMEKRVNGY